MTRSRIQNAILVVLAVVLIAPPAAAVDTVRVVPSEPILDAWRWTVFDADDGLRGRIRDICEARDGSVWFATDEGVHRFDGLRWTTIRKKDGLGSDDVRTLMEDRDGAMWFFTHDGGISRLETDQRSGERTWTRFTAEHGLVSGPLAIASLAQAMDGTIWAGAAAGIGATSPGVFRYDPSPTVRDDPRPWKAVDIPEGNPRPNVASILAARDGSVWFGTSDGLCRFTGAKWQRFTGEEGFESTAHAFGLYEDSRGRIWAAYPNTGGISRYDPSTPVGTGQRAGFGRTPWRTWSPSETGPTVSFWEDEAGDVWVSGLNGITKIHRDALTRIDLADVPHLAGYVRGLRTREGAVWFYGFFKTEASRYLPTGGPEVFTHTDTLFVGPAGPDGSVWFRAQTGAVRHIEGRWLSYGPEDGFLDTRNRTGISGWARSDTAPSLSGQKGRGVWAVGRYRGLGAAFRFTGERWQAFTEDDGMLDAPRSVLRTTSGDVWVAGSHAGGSALCLLTESSAAATGKGPVRWERFTTADGLPGERISIAYEASDGTLWFGTGIDPTSNLGKGLVRFDPSAPARAGASEAGSRWMVFTEETDSLSGGLITGFAEWPRGTLWIGAGQGMHRLDLSALPERKLWRHWDQKTFGINLPKFRNLTPTDRGIWFHPFYPRGAGAFYFDGNTFHHITEDDGLVDNGVYTLTRSRDGALWFAGLNGLSRFADGLWESFGEPDGVPSLTHPGTALTEAHDGSIWVTVGDTRVVRLTYEKRPVPETFIEPTISEVSSAGNLLVRWSGAVPWNRVSSDRLTYVWRLDQGEWTTTDRPDIMLTSLSAGGHTFEVRAVDPNGPADPSPAVHAFTVDLVWWRNPWFIGLVALFAVVTCAQGVRVVRGTKALRRSNEALSNANHELFALNKQLQRERSVERVRGHVQSMEAAEDFEKVLSALTPDLKEVGLAFDACEIDVLDAPDTQPSMVQFERNGFAYTTYRLDPAGAVTFDRYRLSAPFPTVIQETIERFIAGDPWHGTSGGKAIVEVPAASYGRLRLSSTRGKTFSEEEAATLQEFATAIALGYARYLDIRSIQEATERKSAFLASMSHELRTPMNAIKGFVNLVMRREEGLSDRGRDNLAKVDQASDHLLAQINDLLDLSKIEAGRMDVNVTTFGVRTLVESAAASVSPLVPENVELQVEVEQGTGEVRTDEARVRQMLINLLSNAVKFTEKGEVRISATRSRFRVPGSGFPASQPETRNQEPETDFLLFSVSDTGKGIPEEELPTIFDEYRQVKGESESAVQKGTGLGLSITRKFAELLGGEIGVESEVGKGTTFTVRIPAEYRAGEQA